MEEIISGDKSEFELSISEGGAVEIVKRKIYRVETFIIPRMIEDDKVFHGEDLGLDYPDKEDEDEGEKKKKLGALEFPQLSFNLEVESVSDKLKENLYSKGACKEAKESLCHVDKHVLEVESCGGSPAEYFKRDEDRGVGGFLRFDCGLNFVRSETSRPTSTNSIERSQSYDFLPSLKPGSDLKSIKESCEVSYGSCEELCHHGNKNGCTVAAQSPSQVSEEIFKENWMQRLEFLRRRVSLIRDKEVALQERERLLMKKEKELRILERLVKEKIQRADLYLKRCTIRNSVNLEDDLHPNLFLCELSRPSPPPYPEKPRINKPENNPEPDNREILNAGSRTSNRSKGSSSNSTRSGSSRGEKDAKETREAGNTGTLESLKNLEASRTAPSKNFGLNNNLKTLEIPRTVEGPKDFRRSKWSAYSSWRCRSKPKLSYDDLDSTLSADIGDSSFAITSKKLDPRLVQKPRGFARSASERAPKSRPCSLDLEVDLGPDGERVLRKISENISAIKESQGTRFQDYGSIDKRHRSEPKIDDLVKDKIPYRTDQASSVVSKDQLKARKERTSFWNEEASDWLRKKRQAYNLATKRIANRDYENKENFGNSKSVNQKSEKQPRSKNEKGKKFTIFR